MDRGKQSLETICLLLAYKIKYPENFFILRGQWVGQPSLHACVVGLCVSVSVYVLRWWPERGKSGME